MMWLLPFFYVAYLIFNGMLFGRYPPNDPLEWIMLTFMASIFCSIPGLVCAGLAALVGLAFGTHPVETARYKLTAIRDKSGMVGRFFLGSGVIEGDQYYFYYRKNADGSVTPDKVYAGNGVRVYEEKRKDAELVEYEWQLNHAWAYLISIPVNDGGWSYKFHVPKGTVRTGFTM